MHIELDDDLVAQVDELSGPRGRSAFVRVATVLIDFLRGRPVVSRVLALRVAGDVPATTAVNVEEIARGLRGHGDGTSPNAVSRCIRRTA